MPAAPEPTDPSEVRVVDNVREYGWHVAMVLADGDMPGWAYTIGLQHSFGHPELIVFGLSSEVGHAVLNIAGTAIAEGKVFGEKESHGDFLEGYDCVLKPVKSHWYRAFVGCGLRFYRGGTFPLLQLFWPDRDGRFPWFHSGTSQPLLHSTISEARTEVWLRSMNLDVD